MTWAVGAFPTPPGVTFAAVDHFQLEEPAVSVVAII
jgi:hypothetical protein